jgi:hypothetical protein
MAIGDVINPKRARLQANERLDTVDIADVVSDSARDHLDAYSRAVEAAPHNVGSSTPTGLIFQGFGLTLNPTASNDSKVRVQSPTGVAFDSNGRMLIKESGVTVDLTLPAGNSQIYAYFVENSTDVSTRRFISVASPFAESGRSIATKLKSDVGFFTRTGDQTAIVASDVVNGRTTALCFLGVTNNAAGVVTMTGYDAVTAPNGAFAVNRSTSVLAPTTLPPANTAGGSVITMHGLVEAALFMIGQAFWKGSTSFVPSAANNFGAFTSTPAGIAGLFNSLGESVVTPITTWQSWNQKRRSLVDHNGYRMGQVSELDENWCRGGSQSLIVSTASFGTNNSANPANATVNNGVFNFSGPNSAGTWSVPQVTPGMTILSVVANRVLTAPDVMSFEAFDTAPTAGPAAGTRIAVVTGVTTTGAINVPADTARLPWTVPPGHSISTVVGIGATTGNSYIPNWVFTCVVDPDGWAFAPSNNGAGSCQRSYVDPTVNINHRGVRMTGQGTVAAVGVLATEGFETFIGPDTAFVMEWMLRSGTISDGTNKRKFGVGVLNNINDKILAIYNENTTTNWQLEEASINTTTYAIVSGVATDTGVAVVANTTYRMRIEIFGSNVSSVASGSHRVRAFINGALVADITTSTFAEDMIKPVIFSGVTASGGPYDFTVGRLRRVWNHLLNGDNV